MHYTLCDYLVDIIENSIQADSTNIEVQFEERGSDIKCVIADNGKGMDEETLKKALDPFYSEEGKHSNRKFGFGLPFLSQAISAAGARFDITSKPGDGTVLNFLFSKNNFDSPPIGDLVGTILATMCFDGDYEILFKRGMEENGYEISKNELTEVLGDLTAVGNIKLAKQYIYSQEDDLQKNFNL